MFSAHRCVFHNLEVDPFNVYNLFLSFVTRKKGNLTQALIVKTLNTNLYFAHRDIVNSY